MKILMSFSKGVMLVFIAGICMGCLCIDYSAKIQFNGYVVDEKTDDPLENSEIFFLQIPDDLSDAIIHTKFVGTTDSSGQIQGYFIWQWGEVHISSNASPNLNFIVLFNQDKYQTKALYIKCKDLVKKEDTIFVDIGKVKLSKVN